VRRRELIAMLLAGVAACPLRLRADPSKGPVIGLLSSAAADAYAARLAAFRNGLAAAGFVEGRNVAIVQNWADGDYDRLPNLAADLVQRRVSVIAAITTPAVFAAKAATRDIPIVFQMGTDPVSAGLVASLSNPGGNLTGVSLLNAELGPKRLELLHELVPTARAITALLNPANPNAVSLSDNLQVAARTRGLELRLARASNDEEIAAAFRTLAQFRSDGLLIGTDPFFNVRSARIAALANHHKLPAIYQYRAFAAAGGLLSYGGSATEPFHQAGVYTGRVLKGDRPSDLPIVQSSKIELIINIGTARMLGVAIPLALIGRADEVIE